MQLKYVSFTHHEFLKWILCNEIPTSNNFSSQYMYHMTVMYICLYNASDCQMQVEVGPNICLTLNIDMEEFWCQLETWEYHIWFQEWNSLNVLCECLWYRINTYIISKPSSIHHTVQLIKWPVNTVCYMCMYILYTCVCPTFYTVFWPVEQLQFSVSGLSATCDIFSMR